MGHDLRAREEQLQGEGREGEGRWYNEQKVAE